MKNEIEKGEKVMIITGGNPLSLNELEEIYEAGWRLTGVLYCCNITHYFERLNTTGGTSQ